MPKKPPLEAHAEALWVAINNISAEEREYLVRFVTRNAHRPVEEMRERFVADRKDREEAAQIQRHREEKVLDEYRDIMKWRGVDVSLTGVSADAQTETAQAKG
jgi:hypothetical protein